MAQVVKVSPVLVRRAQAQLHELEAAGQTPPEGLRQIAAARPGGRERAAVRAATPGR